MRALFLLLFLITVSFGTVAAQSGCNQLFISEYVEGSSNNKCIEIYNPTGSAIDLAAQAYELKIYSNGNPAANTPTIELTGIIPAYGTYVVCDDSSNPTFLSVANQLSTVTFYNGNDAVALTEDGVLRDVIGQIGFDPGTEWGTGLVSTANNTIRRKSTVTSPDPNGADVFDPSIQWDGFAQDASDGLGSHTSVCTPVTACSIDAVSVTLESSCNDNGTPFNSNDDFVEVDVTIDYTSKPATGNLVLSGDITYSIPVGSIGATSHNAFGFTVPADGTPIQVTATFSDDPGCTLTVNNVTAPMPCSVVPNCGAPFFSEYIEGSGNNKCLEIYNPTASSIDLAAGGYQVQMYFNGSSSPTNFSLTGTILPGDVFVFCNSGGTTDFTGQADQLNGAPWYNGNDAVVLRNTNGTLDVIGQIGMPFPPVSWSGSGVSTMDQTLRRYSSIQKGDNNGSDAFDPSVEWQSYPTNANWGLGYHLTSCRPGLPVSWNPFNVGCPSGTVSHASGTWTLSSNCYEDLSSGVDEQTLAIQELCGDGAITARICGINGLGFAGLTFRESGNANSKQVSLLFQNSQNAHWFTRSVAGAAMQFQSKPRLNRNWLRVTRTDNVFRGYISTNGVAWQLLFQSEIAMGDCMLVGLITESNVDGAGTTANFCNVQPPNFFSRPINDGPVETNEQLSAQDQNNGELDFPVTSDLFDSNNGSELAIRPNPVVNELEVVIPANLQAGALLHIMDMNGRKLFTQRIGEGSNLMLLNLAELNLSAGVYMLNVQDGATVLTKRFVKVN